MQSDWFRERAEFIPSEIIKNVSSLSGNLLNDLRYYVNKNLSVKPLSSSRIISVFITICSLEIVQFVANFAMITALKCSGLSHAFRCVVEKTENVIQQPRSVRIEKNCALCVEYPSILSIQDLGCSFSQYRRTSRLVNNPYQFFFYLSRLEKRRSSYRG